MKVCNYCGELRPCLKADLDFSCGGANIDFMPITGTTFSFFSFNWICKSCVMALERLRERAKKILDSKKIKQQLKWRKQRDKILSSNNKST